MIKSLRPWARPTNLSFASNRLPIDAHKNDVVPEPSLAQASDGVHGRK